MIIIRRQNYVFFLSYQEYINDKKQDTRINLSQKRIALLTNNVTSTIHSHQTSAINKESRIATRKHVVFSGFQRLIDLIKWMPAPASQSCQASKTNEVRANGHDIHRSDLSCDPPLHLTAFASLSKWGKSPPHGGDIYV